MAIKDLSGFESDTTVLLGDGFVFSGGAISSAQRHRDTNGYGGDRSVLLSTFGQYVQIPVSGVAAEDEIHLALYLAAGGGCYLRFFADASNVNARIQFDSDGKIRIYRGDGTTLLATSAGSFAFGAWQSVKFKLTLREAASSGRIRVYLGGALAVDTGANVDCRGHTIDDFTSFRVLSQSVNAVYVDDYVHAASGDLPDEALHIKLLRPTSDGTPTDSTPSTGADQYATVDEDPVSTTDYNELAAAGSEDRLGYGNLGGVPNEILAVKASAYATGQGTITQLRNLAESGASTTYGTNQSLATGGTYSTITDIFATDPATGAAWTQSGVDAANFGYEAN